MHMLKRLRQLKISLAAKCQILFGSAVVLIISAAVSSRQGGAWSKCADQLNERAAGTVARMIVADHVVDQRSRKPGGPTTQPLFSQSVSTTRPSLLIDGQEVLPPRMILIANAKPDDLTRFETSAMQRFVRDPKLPFFARSYDPNNGVEQGYRYARVSRATPQCITNATMKRSRPNRRWPLIRVQPVRQHSLRHHPALHAAGGPAGPGQC